ncbi:MAG: HD domain-containing phosphohydrolase [Gammaproteobacteria bacterium]
MGNPDRYYVEQMTALGESTEVLASEDIRSSMGVKLLKEGAHIDRRVLHRLLQHKLLRPIDYSVLVENAINRDTLIAEGRALMGGDSEVSVLLNLSRTEAFVRQCFARTVLNVAMQNKLTVAYRQRPELFAHSLQVALVARLLGEQLRLDVEELDVVTTAGLFHDIGELHCDPAIFASKVRLTAEQHRHIRAHPITGYLIVKEMQNYPPLISRAVFEHHERLDGSGYPRGVQDRELCRPGKILSLVEFAVGLAQKNTLDDLHTALKLSADKFDREAVGALTALLGARQQREESRCDARELRNTLDTLNRILSDWPKVGENGSSATEEPVRAFIAASVDTLQRNLVQAGLPPDGDPEGLDLFGDDPTLFQELDSVLREALYQIRQTIRETALRWPEFVPTAAAAPPAGLSAWLMETEQRLAARSPDAPKAIIEPS